MRKPNCRTVQRKKRRDPARALLPRKHKFVPVSRESYAAFEALAVGTRADRVLTAAWNALMAWARTEAMRDTTLPRRLESTPAWTAHEGVIRAETVTAKRAALRKWTPVFKEALRRAMLRERGGRRR